MREDVVFGKGSIVGNYEILERLGGGAMGEVYLARHRRLHRQDAVKVLRPEFAADPVFRQRFLGEGRIQAGIRHPNIVEVLEIVEQDKLCALVMRSVHGDPLSAWISRNPAGMPLARVGELMLPVLDAMALAHAKQVVHRDLKPANILVEQRQEVLHPLVVDFGIAWVDSSSTLASLGGSGEGRIRMGTPSYMSPEQARGESVDHRTDVFALGAILHELLTGQKAFDGNTQDEVLEAVRQGVRVPLRRLRPEVPARLVSLVDRCLELDRDLRPARCSELKDELRDALVAPSAKPRSAGVSSPTAQHDGWRRHAVAREGALRRLEDLLLRAEAAPDEQVAADALDTRRLRESLSPRPESGAGDSRSRGCDLRGALAPALARVEASVRAIASRPPSLEESFVGAWCGVPLRPQSSKPARRMQVDAVAALREATDRAWAQHWGDLTAPPGGAVSLEHRIAARRQGRVVAPQGLPSAQHVSAASAGLRRAIAAVPPWPSPHDLGLLADTLGGLVAHLPDERALALLTDASLAAGRPSDPATLGLLDHPGVTTIGARAVAAVALALGDPIRAAERLGPALVDAPDDAELRALAFEAAVEIGDNEALRTHGAWLGGGGSARVLTARARVLRRRGVDEGAVAELSRLAGSADDPVALALRLDLDPQLRPLLPRVPGLLGPDLGVARVARRALPEGTASRAPDWLGLLGSGESLLHGMAWRAGGGVWLTNRRVVVSPGWLSRPVVLRLYEVGIQGVTRGGVLVVGEASVELGDAALADGLLQVGRAAAGVGGHRLSAPR